MIDPDNVPAVASDELLARYILFSKHVRADQTLKPEAFMPHPHSDLSVTRHLMATEAELLAIGLDVADERDRRLYGRGDIQASACADHGLAVRPEPLPRNANHANITGWPADKPAQKNVAQEIAAISTFVRVR